MIYTKNAFMHALEKKRPYYLHTYARKRGIKNNWMKILSEEAVFFGFKQSVGKEDARKGFAMNILWR